MLWHAAIENFGTKLDEITTSGALGTGKQQDAPDVSGGWEAVMLGKVGPLSMMPLLPPVPVPAVLTALPSVGEIIKVDKKVSVGILPSVEIQNSVVKKLRNIENSKKIVFLYGLINPDRMEELAVTKDLQKLYEYIDRANILIQDFDNNTTVVDE